MSDKLVCAECLVVDGAVFPWHKSVKESRVRIGIYGQLCWRCTRNAYSRNSERRKVVQKRLDKQAADDKETGQKKMW